jgi:flavin-dependent dehydrogenase
MRTDYDVIVVGAGPAGLMAAQTMAASHLRVALIEKRNDIGSWRRADCMMFYGLEGGFLGEDLKVSLGRVTFSRNEFGVPYRGGLYPLYHWRVLSPGGHRIDFSSPEPIAAVFDKGVLLRGLADTAESLGVTIFTGTPGIAAENTEQGAQVLIREGSSKRWLKAGKIIAADGINSRIAQSVGLNQDRLFMGRFKVIQYVMEGVHNPYPNSCVQFYGRSLSPFAPLHFLQTVQGEGLQKLGAIRPAPGNPEDDLTAFITRGPYASWFREARTVYKTGVTVRAFMPLARPVLGNVLAVGDAAAFAEVENQGALMCGYRAGRAMVNELDGKAGVDDYVSWWKSSFEFLNPEIHRISQGYAINPYYEDEEIDYLFSLVEGETMEGTINQYKIPRLLWDAIFRHKGLIDRDRPLLGAKIEKIHAMTLQESFGSGDV